MINFHSNSLTLRNGKSISNIYFVNVSRGILNISWRYPVDIWPYFIPPKSFTTPRWINCPVTEINSKVISSTQCICPQSKGKVKLLRCSLLNFLIHFIIHFDIIWTPVCNGEWVVSCITVNDFFPLRWIYKDIGWIWGIASDWTNC